MKINEIKDSQVIISEKPPVIHTHPTEHDIKTYTEYINSKLQELKSEVDKFAKEFHITVWVTSSILTYITYTYMYQGIKSLSLGGKIFFIIFFFFAYMGVLSYLISIAKFKEKKRIKNKAKEYIEEIKNTKPIFNAYCSKNKDYLCQLDLIQEEFEKIKNWKWDEDAP